MREINGFIVEDHKLQGPDGFRRNLINAVKVTLHILYGKGLLDKNDKATEVLKDYLNNVIKEKRSVLSGTVDQKV